MRENSDREPDISEELHLERLFEEQEDMAGNPRAIDFQNLTAAIQALQAALPVVNYALTAQTAAATANTAAINNPPQREIELQIFLISMEEIKIQSHG